MRNFDGIAAAADAVRRFYFRNEDDLPEHVRKRLETHAGTGGSPVDLIVNFTEAVYANRADLPTEAMEIAAGTADVIQQNGFHGGLDGRAAGMIPALRRDSKEKATGVTWPKVDDDPKPNPDFLPPLATQQPAGEA
jgi:hypothetical protein